MKSNYAVTFYDETLFVYTVLLTAENQGDICKQLSAQYKNVVIRSTTAFDEFPDGTFLQIDKQKLPEKERRIIRGYSPYERAMSRKEKPLRLHSKEIIPEKSIYQDVNHEEVLAIIGQAATGERFDYKYPTQDWYYMLKPWTSMKEIMEIEERLRAAGYEVHS